MPAKVENQLLRIGQEAITNAVRHAEPRASTSSCGSTRPTVALRVSDDGRGFEYESPTHTPPTDHYGLTTMRERAEELGGTVHDRLGLARTASRRSSSASDEFGHLAWLSGH